MESNNHDQTENKPIEQIAINLEHVKLNEIELNDKLNKTIHNDSLQQNTYSINNRTVLGQYSNNTFQKNENNSNNKLNRVLKIFFSIFTSILTIFLIILIVAVLVSCKSFIFIKIMSL